MIARAIGFDSDCATLDREARDGLGFGDWSGEVRIARGAGSLRAAIFASPRGRDDVHRAAARLVARAPHVSWVLFAVESAGNRVIIGTPTPAARGIKLSALIVERARVMDSDAETLRLLAAARSDDDLATHARYTEILGRDSLSRRFFRTLESCVAGLAASARIGREGARGEIALLYASRLLFLGFLESKGWLDGDPVFLTRAFDECMAAGGGFHDRVLLPLFFGTLNTPLARRAARARRFGRVPFLNGGLFTPTAVERDLRSLRFSDEACGRLFGDLFSRYRFTAREESSSFEQAAVDPEMLGRTFECLMIPAARRAAGAFYTPHELVDRVTASGLEVMLHSLVGTTDAGALMRGETIGASAAIRVSRALDTIRVLDPACGSGAFLVHVLDRLASMRALAGDDRPAMTLRREVLARSIFGVDVNPTAVWLCQLRLWLSIVIDSPDAGAVDIPPLPNLDRNIRAGDSIAGDAFGQSPHPGAAALRSLRERYARATGRRKVTLSRLLDREERRLLIASSTTELATISRRRRDLIAVRRGRDLFGGRRQATRDELKDAAALRQQSVDARRRIRDAKRGGPLPFSFAAHFADVGAASGFTLVVGNPPWVRPHHVDAATRERLRLSFQVARSAPWSAGAASAGAGKGFSSQVDLAAIFVERSLRLLSSEGSMSLLLPAKLWRSLSGGGMRALVSAEARIARIEDYSDVPAAFDAAVYPGLLVASRDRSPRSSGIRATVLHRARVAAGWTTPLASLVWDSSPGAPWILIPPEVRDAFELLRENGMPLAETPFGRPLLGVKCGLNEAFIVKACRTDGSHSVIAGNGRQAAIDPSMLRPVLRGEQIRPWSAGAAEEHIVWTHGVDGAPLSKLPDEVMRWLAPHRRNLIARADARGTSRWWSLFRTEGAAADRARVVWADIGRHVRATVLPAGDSTVPLNTCYIARGPTITDALALAVILNSPLASAWLSVIAEPARGGYRRYLGWTMALFPVPRRWDLWRELLATVGAEALRSGAALCAGEALDLTISAYGLRRRDVDPLLTWASP